MTSGLAVVSTARLPAPDGAAPPTLPGFVASSFSPLVAAVAEDCLRRRYVEAPLPAELGERTALILASVRGDVGIAREMAGLVDSGRRMSALLFFQCVANAVLGHVAARWGIAGPMVCVSPAGDPAADAMELAAAVIEGGDADAALVLVVEQGWAAGDTDRADATFVVGGTR